MRKCRTVGLWIGCVFGGIALTSPVHAVTVQLGSAVVNSGDSFSVPLTVACDTNILGRYDVDFSYNTNVLRLTGISGGVGEFSSINGAFNTNTPGHVMIASENHSSTNSPAGDVIVANIGFTAVGAPGNSSSLSFNSASALNTAAISLPTVTSNGVVNINGLPPSPAQLSVSPPGLDLGPVFVGQTNTLSFSVVNTGGTNLTGTASVGGPFAIHSGSPFNLAAGQTGTVNVSFIPVGADTASNTVVFSSNGGASTNIVSGVGLIPDTTPPTLVIVNPTGYQTFTNAGITVAGTATDASGIQGVTINGIAADSLVGANWSRSFTLSLGTNTILVVATDNSANANAATQTVQAILIPAASGIDTTAPILHITSPTNGEVIADSHVDVLGDATDDNSVSSVIVTNHRGGIVNANLVGTNWTASSVMLRLGTNRLFAVATDGSTNKSSANVTIVRVNTNYVDTTLRTTGATLTLGNTANSDSITLVGVYNDTAFIFNPANDAAEVMFGDFDASAPSNSFKGLKFKAKASPTNTLTALAFTPKSRTFTFSATGFTLTNTEPFLVAIGLGTNDLGPDSIGFGLPTNAVGKFTYKYGTQLPNVDQFFLGKSTLTTNTFALSGTLNSLSKPNAQTNLVSFGIGSYDETLATNGWIKGAGNLYTYTQPVGFGGAVKTMTLNFDLGTWSATGSGVDLTALLVSPDTDVRLEIGDFAASYRAKLIQKGSKLSY